MIEYELIRTRTMVLIAQITMLERAAKEITPGVRPLGDSCESVSALQAYVLKRLTRVLRGLHRDMLDADAAASPAGRATLQHVAIGKAACGFAAIGADPHVAEALAIGSRVPCLRFSIACQSLRLALGDAFPTPADVPDLPNLVAGRSAVALRRHRVGTAPAFRAVAMEPLAPITTAQGAAK